MWAFCLRLPPIAIALLFIDLFRRFSYFWTMTTAVKLVPNWTPRERPSGRTLAGKFVRLEQLDPLRHSDDLWAALQGPTADPHQWDYLLIGPFPERPLFDAYLKTDAERSDIVAYVAVDVASKRAEGLLCFCTIVPEHGMIEVSLFL